MLTNGAPKQGDVVAGKYRVDDVLGEGGMGVVFSATHQITGKRVALKWMLPALVAHEGAVERFIREAQAAGRIESAHVVDIYDVGQEGEAFFLVMEMLRGEPLTKLLERGDTPLQEVLDLLIGAMRGVAAAHASGVVHRDLKPDNIFVCFDEHAGKSAKILDFGISKLSSGAESNNKLTRTGTMLGTPYYMSPEQARGEKDLDHRVDIYAFGVILYEAITGRVPFDGDTYNALILQIAMGHPVRPGVVRPDVPPSLEAAVVKAMARERDERFQTMRELLAAIDAVRRGLSTGAGEGFSRRMASTRPRSAYASGAPGRESQTPMTGGALVDTLPRRRLSPLWLGAGVAAAVGLLGLALFSARPAHEAAGRAPEQVVAPALRPATEPEAKPKQAGAAPATVPAELPRALEPPPVVAKSAATAAANAKDAGSAAAAQAAQELEVPRGKADFAEPSPTARDAAKSADGARAPKHRPSEHAGRVSNGVAPSPAAPAKQHANVRSGSLERSDF